MVLYSGAVVVIVGGELVQMLVMFYCWCWELLLLAMASANVGGVGTGVGAELLLLAVGRFECWAGSKC